MSRFAGYFFGSFLLLLLLLALLYFPGPNLGLPFAYYGKLNRVLSAIDDCENLEVVRVGIHKDLTLEDFNLDLADGEGTVLSIQFYNSNIRTVSDLLSELDEVECRTTS